MSKAKKILTLLSQGKTVAEVAKATKSAKNYVYYVRWTDAQKNKKSSAKKKPSKIIAAVKEMKTALDALEKERADEARSTKLNKKPTKLFVQPKRFPIADAHFAMGFLNLFEATREQRYLDQAKLLANNLLETSIPGSISSGACTKL